MPVFAIFTEHCPYLRSIDLYVTFTSYFSEEPNQESADKYTRIISNLKVIEN